ncbi:hypothetical protein GXM_05066 [Nostoc sphaeroides CCNUC1]|uniref:Uncharacterized protein n=1 Tax=Nostoc sphaeroides CCNUC1 TaxID=2653204 RepID=A0A5P8W4L1_9NOSO|nr:hypothetical protein GXM_05066 [Nostoc sphaeroides CCNUC1]
MLIGKYSAGFCREIVILIPPLVPKAKVFNLNYGNSIEFMLFIISHNLIQEASLRGDRCYCVTLVLGNGDLSWENLLVLAQSISHNS